MQIADTPDDEVERIKALHSLEILGTEAEERFDLLTRLAAHISKVPISLVSFIDTNRQWFKSCVGLDVRETEREVAFCSHAILGDDLFIIEDATKDPRFHDNPLVTGPPHIRLYIGRVLKSNDGKNLGTLCIIDDKPRKLSADELIILEDLAKMAEEELSATNLAFLDELTQISNRRGFLTLAEKSLNMCKRHDIPATLISFDLDKFKPINDLFGHAEGDHVLRTFASTLTATFRDSDVIARIGGDEFVVLFTSSQSQTAQTSVERFAVEIEKINLSENRGYDIQFSYGIQAITEFDKKLADHLRMADTLMYKHKFSRR